jgi:hypothetical protein
MNKRFYILIGCLFASIGAHAAIYTWDNESGDDQWHNPLNWTNNNGKAPGLADSAVFAASGYSLIETNTHLGSIIVSNTDMDVDLDIPAGYTLKAALTQNYIVWATNTIRMHGGGRYAPTGTIYCGYKSTAGGSVVSHSALTVSNLVFETAQLGSFLVGANVHTTGLISGRVDLAHADIQWNGMSNRLATKGSLIVGSAKGGGTLLVNPSLTNLTVEGPDFWLGCYRTAIKSFIDFGNNPELQTITIATNFRLNNGSFIYAVDGTVVTGMPSQATLRIGAPGKPGTFTLGQVYDIPGVTNRMGNFAAFRAWLSYLSIARIDNNGSDISYSELDLSEASVPILEGSINPSSVNIATVVIAGNQGTPTGVLKLPSTLSALTFNSLEIGSQVGLSGPSNSIIHLGSNTSPIVFTVSNNFSIGYAVFLTANEAGMASNAFPAGSKLRIGTPSSRAVVQFAAKNTQGTVGLFGKGFDDVTLYASNVVMGRGGWASHAHFSTNDFRGATNFVWDVEGEFLIGTNIGDCMFFWFPAYGSGSCSNLSVGQPDSFSYNYRAFLHLSNMPFIVRQAATIKETGIISNYVNGYSSGLDIGTTNLDLQDPNISTNTAYKDYGRMDLRFAGDPVNPYRPYWGLRMNGDGRSLIQTLVTTNATYVYQRLTWSTNGLSAKAQERFGVHYDGVQNVTYIGVSPLVTGSLLIIR